jgi:hypothetical protein
MPRSLWKRAERAAGFNGSEKVRLEMVACEQALQITFNSEVPRPAHPNVKLFK